MLNSSGFTAPEKAVLEHICTAYPTERAALEAQLSTATLKGRENTGCGFFTEFVVDRASTLPLTGDRYRDGGTAKIEGLVHGMGFILFLEKGYANLLEGYSYANENTSQFVWDDVEFEITSPPAEIWMTPRPPRA